LLDGRITLERKVGHEVTSESDEEGPSVEYIRKTRAKTIKLADELSMWSN
jgi:hypothetical protein